MLITYRCRHIPLTEEMKAISSEKIERLSRFLPGMDHAEVVFSEERNKRIAAIDACEVTMSGHGHYVRARASSSSPGAALDLVIDKLDQQLHKLKGKLDGRHHGGPKRGKHHHPGIHVVPNVRPEDLPLLTSNGSATVALLEGGVSPEPVSDDNEAQIVKSKQFAMAAMSVDDAALQMDLLQHDFYLFVNEETGNAALLYRREDGHLGLIDTE